MEYKNLSVGERIYLEIIKDDGIDMLEIADLCNKDSLFREVRELEGLDERIAEIMREKFSERDINILSDFVMERASYAELARRYGLSGGMPKKIISRIRKEMKRPAQFHRITATSSEIWRRSPGMISVLELNLSLRLEKKLVSKMEIMSVKRLIDLYLSDNDGLTELQREEVRQVLAKHHLI